jgi:hypothetical protein
MEQERITHLIEAQDAAWRCSPSSPPRPCGALAAAAAHPQVAQLERLRRTLCSARPGTALDAQLSGRWFEVASERITDLWQLETELVQGLRQACADQLQQLEQELPTPRAWSSGCANTRPPMPTR